MNEIEERLAAVAEACREDEARMRRCLIAKRLPRNIAEAERTDEERMVGLEAVIAETEKVLRTAREELRRVCPHAEVDLMFGRGSEYDAICRRCGKFVSEE